MTTKPYSLEELREMRESITQEEWDADAYIGADDYDDPDLPFVQIGDIRWTPNKVDIPAAIETNDNARVMAAAPALLDQLIETMEELSADRWIPVSERLPETKPYRFQSVLACKENGVVIEAQFNNKLGIFMRNFDAALNGKVTHWKPLPPAPEGE